MTQKLNPHLIFTILYIPMFLYIRTNILLNFIKEFGQPFNTSISKNFPNLNRYIVWSNLLTSTHYYLPLGLKPFNSPNISLAIFLIYLTILFHISFALPCGCRNLPSKMLCWKIPCFSPFKFHQLICGATICFLLSILLVILASITKTLCWVVKISPRITLKSSKFSYLTSRSERNLSENMLPHFYM